jgi:hypothetical protein
VDKSRVGVRGKATEEDPGHGGGKGSVVAVALHTGGAVRCRVLRRKKRKPFSGFGLCHGGMV